MYELDRAERGAARPHRVRRGTRPGLAYTRAWLAAWCSCTAGAGRTAARSPRTCSPCTPARCPRSRANVALGRAARRRGDPARGALDERSPRAAGRARPPAAPPRARRARRGGLALRRPGVRRCGRPGPSIRSCSRSAIPGSPASSRTGSGRPGAGAVPDWIAEPYRLQIEGSRAPPPSVGGHEGARTKRRARWPSPTPRGRRAGAERVRAAGRDAGGEARARASAGPRRTRPARAEADDARQSGGT